MRRVKSLFFLLFLAVTCLAQVKLPDTPAARQCSAWLAVFDGNDREAYRKFLESNFPSRSEEAGREWEFRQRTGGFDLKKVMESSATELVALLQERGSDQFVQLNMEVEGDEPHRITQMAIHPVPRPASFSLQHLSENELLAALKKKLADDSAVDRFSGAALVAKNGKPVFAQAYGLADREHKTPNALNTRFRIGSMNKMFTAVAILQLVQAGKLALDAPIGKYLTDYPNKDVATKVTINHLLSHTGGTGDIFGPQFFEHRLELRTLDDYVKLYGSRPLKFEPGSRWDYSNYGFLLLGRIIEKVSGMSYYDYVRDNIFKVAGMTGTGSDPEDQAIPNRSIGYTQMGPPGAPSDLHPNTDTLPYRGTSAGGGYSTVNDLLAFANALHQNKLLNAHYTELLTTGKTDTPNGRYAYGFADRTINGIRCFGHGGGAPGMNGDLEICPGLGYVVAVLANTDPPAATRVSDFITNRLPEK